MKIAFIADTHLGLQKFREDAFEQAKMAFQKALESADCIILGGDIFDSKVPAPEILAQAIELLTPAKARKWEVKYPQKENGFPAVFAIHGTHERRTKDTINPIQLLEKASLLVNVHASPVLVEKNQERVSIVGIGGVPDEYFKSALSALNFSPAPDSFNIFIFHQTLQEFTPQVPNLASLENLPQGFDLYLCGHIHGRKSLLDGKLLIPGSTVVTQLREEEQQKKGFILYDTKQRSHKFVEIDSRPFIYRELEFTDAKLSEIENSIRSLVDETMATPAGKCNPLIKIKLKGTLAKGTNSCDVDACLNFTGCHLEIDKQFDGDLAQQKIDILRGLRESQASVKELGMNILRERLAENKCALDKPDELFDLIVDEPKKAAEKLGKEV
ncbi:DNA double-strand break repair protein Mre11 [Candidatus Gugararchaeum adminiculabundum]|nr:DNA double-strand break repair protein Mre11 [Candidatus Gugararchaeum adminiculabundum]